MNRLALLLDRAAREFEMESTSTIWEDKGPVQFYCYWGGQSNTKTFTVAAILVGMNGFAFGYDLRNPEIPDFLGMWPMGGVDWAAKAERARRDVECCLKAFHVRTSPRLPALSTSESEASARANQKAAL